MNQASIRQWAILKLLPRSPDMLSTVQILERLDAQGIATSVRTVQRDLNSLSLSFPLVSDESKPQGWGWAEDAPQIELPGLNDHAALTFMLARTVMNHSLSSATLSYLKPWFSIAREKLAEFGDPEKLVAEKFKFITRMPSLEPPLVDTNVQSVIYKSVLLDKQLEIEYKSRKKGINRKYKINPLGIVVVDNVCYLVCNFKSHVDIRSVALHRIKFAELLNTYCERPDGFNLSDYINNGNLGILKSHCLISLEFFMRKEWAYHLYETPLAKNQQIKEINQNWVKVSSIVPDTSQIRWWLRSFGPDVEVLRPSTLRDQFINEANSLAKLYVPKSHKKSKKLKATACDENSKNDEILSSWENLAYKNEYQNILSTEGAMLDALENFEEFEKNMKSRTGT